MFVFIKIRPKISMNETKHKQKCSKETKYSWAKDIFIERHLEIRTSPRMYFFCCFLQILWFCFRKYIIHDNPSPDPVCMHVRYCFVNVHVWWQLTTGNTYFYVYCLRGVEEFICLSILLKIILKITVLKCDLWWAILNIWYNLKIAECVMCTQ